MFIPTTISLFPRIPSAAALLQNSTFTPLESYVPSVPPAQSAALALTASASVINDSFIPTAEIMEMADPSDVIVLDNAETRDYHSSRVPDDELPVAQEVNGPDDRWIPTALEIPREVPRARYESQNNRPSNPQSGAQLPNPTSGL